jgi:hypothetical protein
MKHTVAYMLKGRSVKAGKRPLLGSRSATQWFSSRHVIAAKETHATIEEWWKAVFSIDSVPRLYNEDGLSLRDSLETIVRREKIGVRWSPARENASAGEEERPLLKDVTKKSSEVCD